MPAPAAIRFTVIRLTNVRVNGAALTVNTGVIARINITSPTSFPILNSSGLVVANVLQAMSFSVDETTFDRCVLPPRGERVGDFHLIFTELYGPAFKVIGSAPTQNNIPGGNYPNESGFNPAGATGSLVGLTCATATGECIGQANNPTELKAILRHIPLGVDSVRVDSYVVLTGTAVTNDIVLSPITVSAITGAVGDPNGRTATITAFVSQVNGTALYLPNIVDIRSGLEVGLHCSGAERDCYGAGHTRSDLDDRHYERPPAARAEIC